LEIKSLQGNIIESTREQHTLAKDVELLRQELRIEKHNLQLVYTSYSWRFTAPLRKGLDLLLWISTPFRNLTKNLRAPQEPVLTKESEKPKTKFRYSWEEDGRDSVPLLPNSHFDVLYVIGCLEGESKRYRVFNPLSALRNAGYKVAATVEIDLHYIIDSCITADRIIFFRLAWSPRLSSFMDYAEKTGAKTYFDIDDLVFEPDSIGFVRAIDKYTKLQRANYYHDVQRYRLTLENSGAVITTTDFLADRISSLGKEAFVIPNTINESQIDMAKQILHKKRSKINNTIRIGYFSGTATHDRDFEECEEAVIEILTNYPQCSLVVVGYLNLSPLWKPLKNRIERHDFLPYLDMLSVLGTLDINIAPLEVGNPYCEGKSQLKIFEAALLHVPTVASTTSSYRRAITHGQDGFLATSKEEWVSALTCLITSAEKRRQLGVNAHSRAIKQFGPNALLKSLFSVFNIKAPFIEKSAPNPKETYSSTSQISYKSKSKKGTVGWVIPPLIKGGGGHRTIFQNINALVRAGYECHAYIEPADFQDERALVIAVERDFGCLGAKIHFGVEVQESLDLLFATAVSTAKQVKDCPFAAKKAYFIQDYEAFFHPMGDNYIFSENTYNYGLNSITIGRWLAAKLKSDFISDTWSFDFCANLQVYHPLSNVRRENAVCFVYQPKKPRRCAQLGLESLSIVKRLRPKVTIYLFGSKETLHNIPFEHKNLKLLPIQECNTLYNRCRVGLCISSSNPSRIPFEMMASGLPVVDIFRENNIYDMPDSGVALAEQSPESIAKAIIEILDDEKKQRRMSSSGIRFMAKRPLEKGYKQFIEAVTQVLNGSAPEKRDLKPIYNRAPIVSEQCAITSETTVTPKVIRAGMQRSLTDIKHLLKKTITRQ